VFFTIARKKVKNLIAMFTRYLSGSCLNAITRSKRNEVENLIAMLTRYLVHDYVKAEKTDSASEEGRERLFFDSRTRRRWALTALNVSATF